MFIIYSLLYILAIIVLFQPQYFKRPKDLRHKWLNEKLGSIPEADSAIWIHAVSVGEVNASIPLIKKLRAKYPWFPVVLSTITDTGRRVAVDKVPEGTEVIYLPFDITFILKRCLKRVRPKIFIAIETELWPNIFRVMAENRVPVIILNGRISEKSAKRYRRISFFMKKVFSYVKIFGMQSLLDADRLESIGADRGKIIITGNFKYDMDMPGGTPSWAEDIKGPVIVAGSTHRGEEEIILSACMENLDRFPGLKLILAPRHPERFKEVEDMLRTKGISYVKRSEFANGNKQTWTSENLVVLLDSVGELSSVYGIADIAVIGKSFAGFGGQNPLEPAYWGKPIVCGPHMENFPFIGEFYKEGAAFEVEAAGLGRKIEELLLDPRKKKISGEKARALFIKNAGAVDRAVEIIGEYLN